MICVSNVSAVKKIESRFTFPVGFAFTGSVSVIVLPAGFPLILGFIPSATPAILVIFLITFFTVSVWLSAVSFLIVAVSFCKSAAWLVSCLMGIEFLGILLLKS